MAILANLTEEQESKLAEFRDKWLKIGRCCEPADRVMAEQGATEIYIEAGLSPPKNFIWFDEPFSSAYTGYMLAERIKEIGYLPQIHYVNEIITTQILFNVEQQIMRNVKAAVLNKIRDEMLHIHELIIVNIKMQIVNEVSNNCLKKYRLDKNHSNHSEKFRLRLDQEMGQKIHESASLTNEAALFKDDYLKYCGIESCSRLNGIFKLSQSCGGMLPFNDICILTERPTSIMLDADGQLHNDNGPALVYRGEPSLSLHRCHGL